MSSGCAAEVDPVLLALQHEVQRKLGLCMLLLQQYEHSLKAMVGDMAAEGPVKQLRAIRQTRHAALQTHTLGALVGAFTGGHLRVKRLEGDAGPTEDNRPEDRTTQGAWGSFRFNIVMPPELYEQTKGGLADLVQLRNDLVHHFVDRYDLFEAAGCHAAVAHLDSCRNQIDGHFGRLEDWARSLTATQALASSFLQSKSFEDIFVHGINPDGSVCWPRSSIVECLRRAEAALKVDGWTNLNAAIACIAKENRNQTPSRYGCRTWRQLLRKSEQFDSRTDPGSGSKRGATWYRSRVNS